MDTKKSAEIPATKGMLDEVRSELKSDIASISLKMKAGFENVDSRFSEMNSKIEEVLSAIHGIKALTESQEARNKYVLDGHTNLHDRQDRFEKEIRQDISEIKAAIKN